MIDNFRKQTFLHLIKSAGTISNLVEKSFVEKPKLIYKTLFSVGNGTSVMVPQNPIKDDSSVDIIFQIRGIQTGDTKSASSIGKNAIIVSCENGGIGSKENFAAYGSSNFINQAVGKILDHLKKNFPDKNIHLGKLTISSFSGGGSATAQLLVERDKLPKGTLPPKFVFIDGLHTDPKSQTMKSIVEYANQVKSDPSKGELSIIHTAVIPGNYSSTTETANHILNTVNLTRKKNNLPSNNGINPASVAREGGLSVTQLYDNEQPYMTKDPLTGQMKPNVEGTAGNQHIQSLNYGLKNALT